MSNLHDSRLRQQLADECGAPLGASSCTKVSVTCCCLSIYDALEGLGEFGFEEDTKCGKGNPGESKERHYTPGEADRVIAGPEDPL